MLHQAFLPSFRPGHARFFLTPRFALRAAVFLGFVTGAFAQNPHSNMR